MTAFVFIGNGDHDPMQIEAFGHLFELNGDPVEVSGDVAAKLSGNSHFQAVEGMPVKAGLPSDKSELEALARDLFGVELDKRKSVQNLQKQLQELMDGKVTE